MTRGFARHCEHSRSKNGVASLAGTFEGEFSERTRSYADKGVVRYSW